MMEFKTRWEYGSRVVCLDYKVSPANSPFPSTACVRRLTFYYGWFNHDSSRSHAPSNTKIMLIAKSILTLFLYNVFASVYFAFNYSITCRCKKLTATSVRLIKNEKDLHFNLLIVNKVHLSIQHLNSRICLCKGGWSWVLSFFPPPFSVNIFRNTIILFKFWSSAT